MNERTMLGDVDAAPSVAADVLLAARPSLRRARLWIVLFGVALVLVCALYYLIIYSIYLAASFYYPPEQITYHPLAVHAIGVLLWLFPAGLCVAAAGGSAVMASERYIVTTEHVEIRRGILNRYTKLIPFRSVRDITTSATFDQRLCGLGDVRVIASNGDAITLNDLPDYEATHDLIWRLMPK